MLILRPCDTETNKNRNHSVHFVIGTVVITVKRSGTLDPDPHRCSLSSSTATDSLSCRTRRWSTAASTSGPWETDSSRILGNCSQLLAKVLTPLCPFSLLLLAASRLTEAQLHHVPPCCPEVPTGCALIGPRCCRRRHAEKFS